MFSCKTLWSGRRWGEVVSILFDEWDDDIAVFQEWYLLFICFFKFFVDNI